MRRAKDKKRVKEKKKIKVYKDDKGKFIRLKKKKIRVPPDITERQLLKFVISTLKPKRRKSKKESDETVGPYGKIKKIDPITWSVSQLVSKKNDDLEQQRKELRALRNDVTSQQALIAPVAKLAITDGKKEENKEEKEEESKKKYTDKDIEKGLKMLEEAQLAEQQAERSKEKYKQQTLKKHQALQEEKKKAIEKKRDEEIKALNDERILEYISQKTPLPDLKRLAQVNNLTMTGNRLDIVKRLVQAKKKLPIKRSEALAAIQNNVGYQAIKDVIELQYEEQIKELDIEEIDTSLLETPVRKQKNNNEEEIDSPGTPPPHLEDMSRVQSGDGKRDRGLSTTEIDYLMKKYRKKGFLGTIGSDQIHEFIPYIKPDTRVCWIMNTQKSTQAGDHWVCVLIDARKNGDKSVELYNPLGRVDRPHVRVPFLKNIKPILSALEPDNNLTFKENLIPDQSATSTNCGYFCIKFLKDRLKGDSWRKASGFDQKGEGVIEKFKMTLPKFRILTYDKQTGEGVLRNAYNWAKGKVSDTVNSVKNRIKDVLGGYRLRFPPTIRKLLEKHGDEKISSIKILREPINSMINTILNWVTNGKFDENIKKNGYDSAMHLYMYVQLANGTTIRFDKNQVIHSKIVNFDNQGKNVEIL